MTDNKKPAMTEEIANGVDLCVCIMNAAVKKFGLSDEELENAINSGDEKILSFMGRSVVNFFVYFAEEADAYQSGENK